MNSTIYIVYFVRASESNFGLTSKQEFTTLESALDFAKAHTAKWLIRRNDNTIIAHS